MPLLTLGQAVAAKARLIVWCRKCLHRFEPDTTLWAEEHGGATTVLLWASRLRCTECGARDADFVVTGERSDHLGQWRTVRSRLCKGRNL